MSQPKVTLIITQRERFCFTQMSLESILADNSYPFDLIYVDGGSPNPIREYLQEKANQHDFMTVIRRDHYLKTNEARNLALPLTQDSDYIAFLDNDVIVERGWLKTLVNCAEEEQAALVAPLIFEGNPKLLEKDKPVHIAGGMLQYKQKESGKATLNIYHKMHHVKLGNQQLERKLVDCIEFHTNLVRRSLLNQVILEPDCDSLNSHVDLSLQTKVLGGKTVLEPQARITFINPLLVSGFDQDDIRLHFFRWSEKNLKASLDKMQEKWNLDPKHPFLWEFHRWAILNRQLPLKWATKEGGFARNLLKVCKLRMCPSWLREAIEFTIFKLSFPQSGVPCHLSKEVFVEGEVMTV
jgi:glycosyltransferase involved in cell wall biosynthesis